MHPQSHTGFRRIDTPKTDTEQQAERDLFSARVKEELAKLGDPAPENNPPARGLNPALAAFFRSRLTPAPSLPGQDPGTPTDLPPSDTPSNAPARALDPLSIPHPGQPIDPTYAARLAAIDKVVDVNPHTLDMHYRPSAVSGYFPKGIRRTQSVVDKHIPGELLHTFTVPRASQFSMHTSYYWIDGHAYLQRHVNEYMRLTPLEKETYLPGFLKWELDTYYAEEVYKEKLSLNTMARNQLTLRGVSEQEIRAAIAVCRMHTKLNADAVATKTMTRRELLEAEQKQLTERKKQMRKEINPDIAALAVEAEHNMQQRHNALMHGERPPASKLNKSLKEAWMRVWRDPGDLGEQLRVNEKTRNLQAMEKLRG